jgi:hypothetical protein
MEYLPLECYGNGNGNDIDEKHLLGDGKHEIIPNHIHQQQLKLENFVFIKELTKSYEHEKLDADLNQLRSIEYSFYERKMDLNKCENLWKDLFLDYYFKQKLNLPYNDESFNSIFTGSF